MTIYVYVTNLMPALFNCVPKKGEVMRHLHDYLRVWYQSEASLEVVWYQLSTNLVKIWHASGTN